LLVLAADQKRVKRIFFIDVILVSAKMSSITSVITMMGRLVILSCLETVFSLSWSWYLLSWSHPSKLGVLFGYPEKSGVKLQKLAVKV